MSPIYYDPAMHGNHGIVVIKGNILILVLSLAWSDSRDRSRFINIKLNTVFFNVLVNG